MALVLLLVMSLMGGGLIVITSGDHSSNNTSDQYQQAFYAAETALIEGEKEIVNQYLGPWMLVTDVKPPGPDATDDEKAAYALLKADSENSADGEVFRNKTSRKMPVNDKTAFENNCFNSFKNITQYDSAYKVAYQSSSKNFGELVSPIFNKLTTDMGAAVDDPDTPDVDESYMSEGEKSDIEKEEKYLKRYEYEYFLINIGTAPYKGFGSSIKKTSTDAGSLGTAYKIYGCGIFYGKTEDDTKNHNGVAQIIIPLESLVVMPN